MTRVAVGDLVIAGLIALVLLLGALLWIEWPSGGGTPRVSMDIVSEVLRNRQYDDSTFTRSAAADVFIARGSRRTPTRPWESRTAAPCRWGRVVGSGHPPARRASWPSD